MWKRTLITGAVFFLAVFSALAQNAPVRVLASNGVKAVIDEL